MTSDDEISAVGPKYLDAVDDQDAKSLRDFAKWVQNSPPDVQSALNAVGSAFWVLNGIATCEWDCSGGDHLAERVVARAASNAKGARQLLQKGYYDEAMSLVRQIGETANLVGLFVAEEGTFIDWAKADWEKRRDNFGPSPVRRRLKKLGRPLPMGDDLYGMLSGLSVHVTPETAPQNHNRYQLATLGGHFQEKGALASLGLLCDVVGILLVVTVMFTGPPVDREKVAKLARRLLGFGEKWHPDALEESQRNFQHTGAIDDAVREQQLKRQLRLLIAETPDA